MLPKSFDRPKSTDIFQRRRTPIKRENSMRAVNDSFTKNTIELDGGEFIDSTFAECKLVYHGGALPKIEGSSLDNSHFALRGSAANTTQFLKLLWALGERDAVENILADIKGA